jgi:diguanylate cyclase (GGDEF)-like protein
MFQLTIWSLPPLIAALSCALLYARARKRSNVPGVSAILALLAGVIYWSIAQVLGSSLILLDHKVLAAQLAFVGIELVPVAWFVFAMNLARSETRLPRFWLNAICIVPLITIALALTNAHHELIWSSARLVETDGQVALIFENGPGFYATTAYSYALILIGTSILAFSIAQSGGSRRALLAVVFAPLIVCATNLVYISPWNPAPWFDMTTLGFAVATVLIDQGVLRDGLLDHQPVVRERVVEQLSDGVVVIDSEGTITDLNPAAAGILGATREALLNAQVTDHIRTVSLPILRTSRLPLELTVAQRAFDVTSSDLDAANPHSNVVLVFRDVTSRRADERQLKKMQRQLERLAHTDALTGLYNRRVFMQRLEEEIERVKRHGSVLSVLLFDLDLFKLVNDSHGHAAGDTVLQSIAATTMELKRLTDVAARLGGEEFGVLLPETAQQGAVLAANRLRETIAARPVQYASQLIEVTISIGVATVTQRAGGSNVLKIADEALYRAKNSGRNMVCCTEA